MLHRSGEGGLPFADLIMRLRILVEGKTRNAHLRALETDYQNRISHFADIQVEEIRPPKKANSGRSDGLSAGERRIIEKLKGSPKILLDERGREWTSKEFAEWIGQQQLQGTREVVFVVGAPDGFSAAFRQQANLLLAVSRMTLTRDWARALLMEQIYRALTILRGYPYPR